MRHRRTAAGSVSEQGVASGRRIVTSKKQDPRTKNQEDCGLPLSFPALPFASVTSDHSQDPTRTAFARVTAWIEQYLDDQERYPVLSRVAPRSEEHTSELQSLAYLVCRLLL